MTELHEIKKRQADLVVCSCGDRFDTYGQYLAHSRAGDMETGCEVTVTFKLFRRFNRPKFSLRCTHRASWISINMCCGSTSRACNFHHDLAEMESRGKTLRCGECGHADTHMIWSEFS